MNSKQALWLSARFLDEIIDVLKVTAAFTSATAASVAFYQRFEPPEDPEVLRWATNLAAVSALAVTGFSSLLFGSAREERSSLLIGFIKLGIIFPIYIFLATGFRPEKGYNVDPSSWYFWVSAIPLFAVNLICFYVLLHKLSQMLKSALSCSQWLDPLDPQIALSASRDARRRCQPPLWLQLWRASRFKSSMVVEPEEAAILDEPTQDNDNNLRYQTLNEGKLQGCKSKIELTEDEQSIVKIFQCKYSYQLPDNPVRLYTIHYNVTNKAYDLIRVNFHGEDEHYEQSIFSQLDTLKGMQVSEVPITSEQLNTQVDNLNQVLSNPRNYSQYDTHPASYLNKIFIVPDLELKERIDVFTQALCQRANTAPTESLDTSAQQTLC